MRVLLWGEMYGQEALYSTDMILLSWAGLLLGVAPVACGGGFLAGFGGCGGCGALQWLLGEGGWCSTARKGGGRFGGWAVEFRFIQISP